MKAFLVQEIGDPYEPPGTIAVCSSIEVAKALGFKQLWQHVHTERQYQDGPGAKKAGFIDYDKSYVDHLNLMTGKTKRYSYTDFPPSPYIEEVEMDKKLI